jgi:cystathionine gamma-synthase/cystathionine gamma-lyase
MTDKEPVDGQRFETRAIHEGEDPAENHGAVIPPIYMSSTYEHIEIGKMGEYDYSRTGSPTRDMLEQKVASLESGSHGLAFASGMAAINAVLVLMDSGDHIVAEENVYGGTHRLLTKLYPKYNVDITWVDATDLKKMEEVFTPKTKMLLIETPTNPLLKVVDIQACAKIAHERGALLVVDSTFASPYLQRPLELGADIVVHSTTKYIGGHSDFVGGIVVTGNEQLAGRLAYFQNACGAVPSPFDCWLAARSVKTLALRMREHCRNARLIAEHLDKDPRVRTVHYPGLKSHPGHELAKRQMFDFGGIISFELKADFEETKRFVSELRLFSLAVSLGAVESLVAHPVTMTHTTLSPEERDRTGIHHNLVRISVGIEHPGDLIADIDNALLHAMGKPEEGD